MLKYMHFLIVHVLYLILNLMNKSIVAAGKEDERLPYLLYLQGGPGFESPRPTDASGWIGKACEGYRVVLLDQAWLNEISFSRN